MLKLQTFELIFNIFVILEIKKKNYLHEHYMSKLRFIQNSE